MKAKYRNIGYLSSLSTDNLLSNAEEAAKALNEGTLQEYLINLNMGSPTITSITVVREPFE